MDSSLLTRQQAAAHSIRIGYVGSKSTPRGIRPVHTRATRKPSRAQTQIVSASKSDRWHIETEAVHVGDHEHIAGAAITPIFQSATYLFDGDTAKGKAEVKYARCNNTPNHHVSPPCSFMSCLMQSFKQPAGHHCTSVAAAHNSCHLHAFSAMQAIDALLQNLIHSQLASVVEFDLLLSDTLLLLSHGIIMAWSWHRLCAAT